MTVAANIVASDVTCTEEQKLELGQALIALEALIASAEFMLAFIQTEAEAFNPIIDCENTANIGKAEWAPIIDCREELNLAVTPPGMNWWVSIFKVIFLFSRCNQ